MCGIVGVFSNSGKAVVSESELIIMRDTMTCRGPDDAGVFFQHTENYFLGLGHRRLSIIDLSPNGHQPMSIEKDNLHIVFNGEIFNYKELKTELENKRKYTFTSDSDTEVLLYSIKEWGLKGALNRFRGMYAFALFDSISGNLTLVRDPLGVKPLYYYRNLAFFVFASEIKAILSMPGIEKRLNEISMLHYLTFANAPSPFTFFEGIQKLEPGTYLTVDVHGQINKTQYWDPSTFQPSSHILNENEYAEELIRLLRQSIARRMVSDVPFGVFLSGGVDSSLNVALMSEMMDRPVSTFTVGIKNDPSNELDYARKVAKLFHTKHHEIILDENDFINFLPSMPYFQDEPLADPVCVPLYYVSELARQSGTIVIQVGEGSDEIFAGYKMYHLFNRANRFAYQPFLKLPYKIKCSIHKYLSIAFPAWIADAVLRSCRNYPLFMGNAIAFWDTEKQFYLRNFSPDNYSSSFINNLSTKINVSDPLLKIINIELKNRLPELLLMRVDKMSMANSIETRVPFLDEDLVQFALSIPSQLKYKNGETKYILKKAAEGILPNEIIYRRKSGFCGSATNMLTKNIAQYAYKEINDSQFIKTYFHTIQIETLFRNFSKSQRFNSFKIWNLLNLVLWHKHWFE